MSSQSTKSSFCKIQIFEFTNSALPVFYSFFRLSIVVILDMFISTGLFIVSFRFVSQNTVGHVWISEVTVLVQSVFHAF